MSQRHSDSSLEQKLLECRFHSELQLDAQGNPAPSLRMARGSLQLRGDAATQLDTLAPPPPAPEGEETRAVVLSTHSPVALRMGTQQLIPRSLAMTSKTKTPARHQSFGAAMLSKEASRRDPQLLPTTSFSLDDMAVDTGSGAMLRRNLRNQSYRAAMRGAGPPGGEGGSIQLSPRLQALAEEPSQPPRHPTRNKVGGCVPGWGLWAGRGLAVTLPSCGCCLVSTYSVQDPGTAYSSEAQRPGHELSVNVPISQTRQPRFRKVQGFTHDPRLWCPRSQPRQGAELQEQPAPTPGPKRACLRMGFSSGGEAAAAWAQTARGAPAGDPGQRLLLASPAQEPDASRPCLTAVPPRHPREIGAGGKGACSGPSGPRLLSQTPLPQTPAVTMGCGTTTYQCWHRGYRAMGQGTKAIVLS